MQQTSELLFELTLLFCQTLVTPRAGVQIRTGAYYVSEAQTVDDMFAWQ